MRIFRPFIAFAVLTTSLSCVSDSATLEGIIKKGKRPPVDQLQAKLGGKQVILDDKAGVDHFMEKLGEAIELGQSFPGGGRIASIDLISGKTKVLALRAILPREKQEEIFIELQPFSLDDPVYYSVSFADPPGSFRQFLKELAD